MAQRREAPSGRPRMSHYSFHSSQTIPRLLIYNARRLAGSENFAGHGHRVPSAGHRVIRRYGQHEDSIQSTAMQASGSDQRNHNRRIARAQAMSWMEEFVTGKLSGLASRQCSFQWTRGPRLADPRISGRGSWLREIALWLQIPAFDEPGRRTASVGDGDESIAGLRQRRNKIVAPRGRHQSRAWGSNVV